MYYKYVEFLKLWKGGEMFANLLCCFQTLTDKSRPEDVKKKEVVMHQRNNIMQCLVKRVILNHHYL